MTFTAAIPITACQVCRPQSLRVSVTHPSAMNPLCSQSSSNRIARRSVVGAWMRTVSKGRERVGGY